MPQQFEDETIDDDQTDEATDDDNKDDDRDVSDRLKTVEQNQALNALLADPEVQEVIRLKRDGKVVKVDEQAKEEEEEEKEAEEKIDDDDPAKEVLKRFVNIIEKKLTPISERLASIESLADDVRKKDVNSQIKAVRDNHEDFDKYKEQMLMLSKDNTGLDVEELYMLARKRAGKLDLTDPSTFSEKPTTQTLPNRARKAARTSARQRGRLGFQKILASALDSLEIDLE